MTQLTCDLFQGEGVAYRGRILVELSTQLDGKIDKNVDDISSDDILVAQVENREYECDTVHSMKLGAETENKVRDWKSVKSNVATSF